MDVKKLDLAGFDGCPDRAAVQDHRVRCSISLAYLPVNGVSSKIAQGGLSVPVPRCRLSIEVKFSNSNNLLHCGLNFRSNICDHFLQFRIAPFVSSHFRQAFRKLAVLIGQNTDILQVIARLGDQDIVSFFVFDNLVLHQMVVTVDHYAQSAGICHNILRVVSIIGLYFPKMAQAYDYGTALPFQFINLRLRCSIQFFSLVKRQTGCIFWRRSSSGSGRIQPEHTDLRTV